MVELDGWWHEDSAQSHMMTSYGSPTETSSDSSFEPSSSSAPCSMHAAIQSVASSKCSCFATRSSEEPERSKNEKVDNEEHHIRVDGVSFVALV